MDGRGFIQRQAYDTGSSLNGITQRALTVAYCVVRHDFTTLFRVHVISTMVKGAVYHALPRHTQNVCGAILVG